MLNYPATMLLTYLLDVGIHTPNLENLNRLNEDRKQLWILSNYKNMFCSDKENLIFDISPEVGLGMLAAEIKKYSKNIKFNLLIIPAKTVQYVRLDFFNNIIIRIIEYYEIRIDEILTRYDILIEKVNSNA